MKLRYLVVSGLACAAVQAASAASSIGAEQLAGITAAVETCEKFDRSAGARLEQEAEILLRGLSDRTQKEMRQGAAYRSAYSQYIHLFASLPAADLSSLCLVPDTRRDSTPRRGRS